LRRDIVPAPCGTLLNQTHGSLHMPSSEPTVSPALSRLSPRRKSTTATDIDGLVVEQLAHFGIDPGTDFGQSLAQLSHRLYSCQGDVDRLWEVTLTSINSLDESDKIAYFNAKKFLAFQFAKLLDNLQNPFRKAYQGLGYAQGTLAAKGPYAMIDNVSAIFSATPVITRTATYVYACAEWIADAFEGKELMHEIYSRLLNPTSIALANHIVDIECGPEAGDYFAWNFNSGMAAIDATLSHLLGRDDILITSKNLYGGSHQLIHDWFAKPGNLAIAVERFDGFGVESFLDAFERAQEKHAGRLSQGRKIYLHLESPCNPHGYLLDVPAICKAAHARGIRVILDATVATPFLIRPLRHEDCDARPDFVIHSYTKDLSGTGSVIAGVVIGRIADMFAPKGYTDGEVPWDQTMFWNVYYIKGAFLNADGAYEVLQGMKTLEQRMMTKCINTAIVARFMAGHPEIKVRCSSLDEDPNSKLREEQMFLGLPAPLFTTEMPTVPADAFRRFFDCLSPTFGHMISLGQTNTIVSCPALTTHSELDESALHAADIAPTTIRFAIGNENPRDLVNHLVNAAKLAIDSDAPGFSDGFMDADARRDLIRSVYVEVHRRYIDAATAGE